MCDGQIVILLIQSTRSFPNSSCLSSLTKQNKEKLFVGKLEIDNCCNRLCQAELIRMSFWITANFYRKRQREAVAVPSYHSDVVDSLCEYLTSHTQRLLLPQSVTERERQVERSELADRHEVPFCPVHRWLLRSWNRQKKSDADVRSRSGSFWASGAIAKPSKSERPHKNNERRILGIEFSKRGSPEPSCEKLANLISKTAKVLSSSFEMWVNYKSFWVIGTASCFSRGRQCPYSKRVSK